MINFFINIFSSSLQATAIMRELYQLSDRELADIGISRSQIPSIAYDATKNRD